jgi:hypothetical protein
VILMDDTNITNNPNPAAVPGAVPTNTPVQSPNVPMQAPEIPEPAPEPQVPVDNPAPTVPVVEPEVPANPIPGTPPGAQTV